VAEIEKQFTRLEAAEAALLRGRANLKRYRAACLQAVSVEGPTTMFGSLCRDASYGSSVKCDYAFDGPPVVRIPNIERGHLRLDDLKFAPGMATFNDRDALAPGDFLVIRTNGSRNLIGRAALVDHELDRRCYYASYLIRFRLALDPLRQRWLSVVWDAPRIRVQVERAAATSAGQYNLSIGALARVSVPIPPPERLAGILSEIEDRLSVVQKVADVIEANLQRAARLREAILKRAFEGKLVPQDPNDEPASVLLERIRRQRAERQNSAPLRQRRRRKDVS
jgi:type I restriction enzyme S subunit